MINTIQKSEICLITAVKTILATSTVVVKRKSTTATRSRALRRITSYRIILHLFLERIANSVINSEVPYYEDEEVQEYEPEPAEDGEQMQNGDEDADNVIVSGDPSAAAKDNAKSHKDKKIPNDQRITTPYMTKYEKARILGTRALQIRYDTALAVYT